MAAAHSTLLGVRNQARFAFAKLLAAIALSASLTGAAIAQQGNAILAQGNAAVTGFAGALPPIQIPAGVDPAQQTFIDPSGPSLRIVDLQHMGAMPSDQLVAAPKPTTWFANQIGQVFGVAADNATPPNIYVAATSAYGLPIVAPGPNGQPQHIKVGAPNATFMPGLWGPQGGPGSIWKIDGATGAVSLFANVMLGDRTNSGPALGGLAFDPDSKSLFVADRETGFIHRFGMDGRGLGRYGHGVTGREAQGLTAVRWHLQQRIDLASPQFDSTAPATWNYAVPERRVFGLAVYQHRLYYAVADSLQIWSVGLKDDGSFDSDAVIELAVPPASGPTEISKITFDEQGRMFLAERPAPTGAFDFEALAVPAIGRVLRYALAGTMPDGRRIWQESPDEYAIGFPLDLRNGNGGVAIGYRYNAKGDLLPASCGGFMWSTGEDLRDAADVALAEKLKQSGPLNVDGLQGNETWRVRRDHEPPLAAYFVDYDDKFDEDAARGRMGDVAIVRGCASLPPTQIEIYPTTPGGQPGGHPGAPPGHPGTPPGGRTPPSGGCPPNQVRNASTGDCGQCPRPNIQINGKCCAVGSLVANAACSNSSCPSGQTAIGPSNFCCNSSQVYAGAGGAQACCGGQLVNGQCPSPTTPPNCTPGPTNPQCPCGTGYVASGGSCCLASQMTSAGTCCPSGQAPSGPNKGQCSIIIIPPIHIGGPSCCASGLIPVGISGKCCAPANVTTTGVCCATAVDPNNRSSCPAKIQSITACAPGYSRMPDGSCCNNRFIGDDGTSCITRQPVCAKGEFRDSSGACAPVAPPGCASDEVRDRNGNCVSAGSPPPIIGGGPPRRHVVPPRAGPRRPGGTLSGRPVYRGGGGFGGGGFGGGRGGGFRR
jgi:hypothetical protein